jgi:hypothetical protein
MVDFKSILQEIGYDNITETSKELRMRPVYRDSDNNTVLVVYKDNGKWIDFARSVSGSFEELIRLTLKLNSIEESRKWLKDKNIEVNNEPPKPKITTPKTFDKEILLRLLKDYSYWEGRGISKGTLEKFGGGVATKGKMAGRYVFPVYDSGQKIVGFAGRDIYNNSDRAKWKLIGSVKDWVYPAFLEAQYLQNYKTAILLESLGDLLSLYEAGIANCLVLFGLNLSPAIINFLIKNDCQKIIISLNNDADFKETKAGNEGSKSVHKKLCHFFDTCQIETRLPKLANDWGDTLVKFGKEEIRKVFNDVYPGK